MFHTRLLFLIVLLAVYVVVFWLPMLNKRQKKAVQRLTEKLADLTEPPVKIDLNRCSRQCCLHTQWPVPFDLKDKDMPDEELKNYVSTNFSCNGGEKSGCVCVSKNDFDYLSNRGTNVSSSCARQ